MKTIPLVNKRGVVMDHALVDDDDYERLVEHRWQLALPRRSRCGYAVRGIWNNGKPACLMMHREILRLPPARVPQVDHLDMNGLNNQKANLRTVTHSQNQWNRTAYRCNQTGLKGVTVSRGRFQARIRVYGKLYNIGSYGTAKEAHQAYVERAKIMHGEFFHA